MLIPDIPLSEEMSSESVKAKQKEQNPFQNFLESKCRHSLGPHLQR